MKKKRVLLGQNSILKIAKEKIYPWAVEAHKVVRRRGSHII
jgi:hypothetical protein